MLRLRSILLLLMLAVCLGAASAQPVPSLSKALDDVLERGTREYSAGEYDKAIATYTGYLKARPKDPAALFNRGIAYFEKARTAPTRELYERSVNDLSEAIKLRPNDEAALVARGHSYLALRSTDPLRFSRLVIADMTEAIRLNPKLAAAFQGRGEAHWEIGDTKRAEADLTEAIRLDPQNGYFYFRRGNMRYGTNSEGAKADFRAALKIDPKNYLAQRWLDDLDSKTVAATSVAKLAAPAPVGPAVPAVSGAPAGTASTATAPPISTEVLSAEASKLLTAKQPERALPLLQQALGLIPAGGPDTFSKLQAARRRALITEKMAWSYFFMKDYARAINTYISTQKALSDAIGDDQGGLLEEIKRTPHVGENIAMYEARVPAHMQLIQIGTNGVGLFSSVELAQDLKPMASLINIARAAAAVLCAKTLSTISEARYDVAASCRAGRLKCGPGTGFDPTDKLLADALAGVNKAMEIVPEKRHYAIRANIYRALGNIAAAAADETRAM